MASNEKQRKQLYLTKRQKECLCRTADGMTAQAIGHELGISVRMVRWHLQRAREQLGAASSAQAVQKAFRAGLLN